MLPVEEILIKRYWLPFLPTSSKQNFIDIKPKISQSETQIIIINYVEPLFEMLSPEILECLKVRFNKIVDLVSGVLEFAPRARITLEPSQALLEFMATVRASDIKS